MEKDQNQENIDKTSKKDQNDLNEDPELPTYEDAILENQQLNTNDLGPPPYQENFRKHEEMIAGVSNTDLDMEELFSEAEKLLEDDDASDGSDTQVGNTPDIESGTTGGGTELPPTGSVPYQG